MTLDALDALNERVTEAILRAEAFEAEGPPIEVSKAYFDVSACEEEIAKRLPASDEEGAIARRGAVRAALKAGLPTLARELADRYIVEAGAPAELVEELRSMGAQADDELSRDPRRGVCVVSAARYRFHDAA